MMRKRGWIALAAAAVLGVSALCFTACGGSSDYDYDITLWVGEGTQQLTYDMIDAFNEADESVNGGYKLKATVEVQSESSAAGNAISKPSSCADIFCIAQDQLARVVYSQLTTAPNTASTNFINDTMDSESIDAAKIGGKLQAFPLTRDNGIFMYYDKSVITNSEDLTDLATLVKDCEDAKENFSMNLTNNGAWYAASFFYAVGCYSEWTTDESGVFTGYQDNIYVTSDNLSQKSYATSSDIGLGQIAVQGMSILLGSTAYDKSSDASCLTAGTRSAVYVSGIWDYNAAKSALGSNLGIAPLPSFKVGDNTYQLKSYMGSKLLCVKPQTDAYKASALQYLARYLTGETCQTQRYNEVGWGPSNTNAAAAATGSEALNVLKSEISNGQTTPQGQYPTNWWTALALVAGNTYDAVKNGGTLNDSTVNSWLSTYDNTLSTLLGADTTSTSTDSE